MAVRRSADEGARGGGQGNTTPPAASRDLRATSKGSAAVRERREEARAGEAAKQCQWIGRCLARRARLQEKKNRVLARPEIVSLLPTRLAQVGGRKGAVTDG